MFQCKVNCNYGITSTILITYPFYRWRARVTYYRWIIINSFYLHYTTIWLIWKLPQVFYRLPGSAVHVLVEKYPEHGDLYGEYTALWKRFLVIFNNFCYQSYMEWLLTCPNCSQDRVTMRQNFIIDVFSSEVNAYWKLLPAEVKKFLSRINGWDIK